MGLSPKRELELPLPRLVWAQSLFSVSSFVPRPAPFLEGVTGPLGVETDFSSLGPVHRYLCLHPRLAPVEEGRKRGRRIGDGRGGKGTGNRREEERKDSGRKGRVQKTERKKIEQETRVLRRPGVVEGG